MKALCNSLVFISIHELMVHPRVDSTFDLMQGGADLVKAMNDSAVFVCSPAQF